MPPDRKRILCVDNDGDLCKLLAALFAHLGYEIITTDSPRAALEESRRGSFDLYVVDADFPEGSGIDLCGTLREHTPRVPVIFYSAMDGEEAQEAGVCAGAAAYVPKPHLDELIKTAQRLLRNEELTSASRALDVHPLGL